MRIVAIRGSNLASLKGDFAVELDQPPLSNLGLFAIHGPVGAGKSTLLDALTLALFGRTPRLSGSGGAVLSRGDDDVDQLRANDPATLVRRGAASAHAEVDFIGHDGRLYRARWDIRRGRTVKGRPGRLQDEKQSLRDVVNDAVIGDGNSAVRRLIEERLGLSFDELCRSVLLAQGGFQGFLQAKPGERAELLEKVTGTGIYSRLGEAAFARAREVEQGLKALEARLDGQPALDEGARSALEATVVLQGSAAANADARASALRHTLERRRATRALHRAAADVDAALAIRDRAVAAEANARAGADAARGRLDALTPLLVEHERAQAALAMPQARLVDATRALAERDAVVVRRREVHAAAVVAADAARAGVDAAVADRGAVEAEVAGLLGPTDARALDARLQEGIRAVDDAADAAVALSGTRAIADAAAGDVALMAAALDAAITQRVVATAAATAALPAGVAVADHAAATAAAAAHVVARATAEVATLGAGIAIREGVVARLEAALAEQAARRALRAARDALRDDEPCPVCGSCTHPARAHVVGETAPAQDPVDAVVGAERQALQRALEHRAAARALIDAVAGRAAKADTIRATAVATPSTLDEARALLARLDDAAPAVFAVADADVACSRATAALDAARAAHAVQVSQQEQARARFDAARAGLVGLGLAVNDPTDDPTGPGALRTLATTLRRYREALAAASSAVDGATATVQRLDHDVAAAREALVAAEAEAAATRAVVVEREAAALDASAAVTKATAALAAHGVVGDVVAFGQTLRAEVDDATRTLQARSGAARDADVALAAARHQHAERQEALERLGGALADVEIGDDDSDLQARIETVAAEAVAAREAAATARARLAHDDQIRAERARLAADLERARAEGEVWRSLSTLIGSADGGRFRQFAQGLTLDALVTHANEHLAVLAPRYRLRRTKSEQQKHDLDLVIVDTEAGADVRSTQTLSGGESFLVSLALALGLSSLSANEGARGRVESLFIDEGFSALDQETLDVALSAFDALRQTGRQIGVISHVPLLMERLGAQVRVIPIGGGASRVEVHAS